jgi:hypothetical protein
LISAPRERAPNSLAYVPVSFKVLGALVVSRNMDPMFGAIVESADLLQCDGSVYSARLIMYPTCTSSGTVYFGADQGVRSRISFSEGSDVSLVSPIGQIGQKNTR